MTALFTQTIIQFAPLRTFARMVHTYAQYSQLIRELFPKALFDEQNATYEVFIEIAWSFLSKPEILRYCGKWYIYQTQFHRIGGLPAIIRTNSQQWNKNNKPHRDDKDPQTGLTLPAVIRADGSQIWYKNNKPHRDDKDPRTGLTLPAVIHQSGTQDWYKDDKDDKDPRTGLTLPAKISRIDFHWCKDGKKHRVDKDPKTGLTFPAIIYANGSREWYIDGHLHNDKDPKTGLTLPAII